MIKAVWNIRKNIVYIITTNRHNFLEPKRIQTLQIETSKNPHTQVLGAVTKAALPPSSCPPPRPARRAPPPWVRLLGGINAFGALQPSFVVSGQPRVSAGKVAGHNRPR